MVWNLSVPLILSLISEDSLNFSIIELRSSTSNNSEYERQHASNSEIDNSLDRQEKYFISGSVGEINTRTSTPFKIGPAQSVQNSESSLEPLFYTTSINNQTILSLNSNNDQSG